MFAKNPELSRPLRILTENYEFFSKFWIFHEKLGICRKIHELLRKVRESFNKLGKSHEPLKSSANIEDNHNFRKHLETFSEMLHRSASVGSNGGKWGNGAGVGIKMLSGVPLLWAN